MRALNDRRFRWLLLAWVGVPVAVLYVWTDIVEPLAFNTYLGDFQESYMRAAARIAGGLDPYDLCQKLGCSEPTGPQYVMPPLLAWLLQPLVGVSSHALGAAVIIALNLSLALFIWSALCALKIRDPQLAVLLVLVALTFAVDGNVAEGQVNLVLLALSGLWLVAWVGEEWWGGIALGAAVALKLIQAPVGVLVLMRRRWGMLAAAAATGAALWLLAAPQDLFEYLTQVAPAISAGTGIYENQSPGGTITRLLEPDTFTGAVRGSPTTARVLTLVIALAALAVTLWVLRSPVPGVAGRSLEAAAIVAVTPMLTTYSWGTHLVLLQVPLLVLIAWGVRRGDWTVLALVAAGYLLIGPGHHWFQTVLVSGYSNIVVLRLMAEFGVTGVIAIWIASLIAIRRDRHPVGESAD
ncbi:MAG: glycosyltransferase family 87 protein [Candidatus Dormibacterales bacterium]